MTEAYLANATLRAAAAEDKRTIAALQTELGETKEMLQVAQVTSEAIINSLRRDLHRSQQELVAESTKLADERLKWNDERGYLILAAGNNEDAIMDRIRAYIDKIPCGTKRPRTDDDAGDGGRAP